MQFLKDAHLNVKHHFEKGGKLDEESMVGRALALHKLGKRDQERAAWAALLSQHPNSIHAARARQRLSELQRRE